MINPKPTLSGITLLFGDKQDLQNESSVSCPTFIDCASCHYLYANHQTGLYGKPLHQNWLKEVFEENIFLSHPPSLVPSLSNWRCPCTFLGRHCLKPSPWLILFKSMSIQLDLDLLNDACLRMQAACRIDLQVNRLRRRCIWVGTSTHTFHLHTLA